MRAGGEKRGNSADRRARKFWMINALGDGHTVACVHCSLNLICATVEADRIIPGASYRRSNIQPACRSCNLARSNDSEWVLTS